MHWWEFVISVHSICQSEGNYYRPTYGRVSYSSIFWDWKTLRSATKAGLSCSEYAARLLCAGLTAVRQSETLPSSTWLSDTRKMCKGIYILPFGLIDNKLMHACSTGTRDCSWFLLERSLKAPCTITSSKGGTPTTISNQLKDNCKFTIVQFELILMNNIFAPPVMQDYVPRRLRGKC